MGYDGFKHRKGTKIHVVVDRDSMPLRIVIGPRNEHDSKKLLELVGDLDWKLCSSTQTQHTIRNP